MNEVSNQCFKQNKISLPLEIIILCLSKRAVFQYHLLMKVKSGLQVLKVVMKYE